jgi:antitoxin component YwqK of YwqJK toxin-antitoxin module
MFIPALLYGQYVPQQSDTIKQYKKASVEYYEDSTLKKIQTLKLDDEGDLIAEGRFVEWYPEGTRKREGFIRNGSLDSTLIEYRQDMTKKSETLYREGKKIKETIYGKRGLASVDDKEEQNVLTRVERVVFPDGRLVVKEGYDENAGLFINHGKSAVYYYVDGPVNEEGSFRHGRMHGLITNWREDGTKAYDGIFKSHWMEDLWIYFDENGRPEKEVIFNKSKESSIKFFEIVPDSLIKSE